MMASDVSTSGTTDLSSATAAAIASSHDPASRRPLPPLRSSPRSSLRCGAHCDAHSAGRLMTETLGRVDAGSLERSCRPRRDSIRLGAGADGLQPMQAYVSATGFEPHRHDTYGIGITIAGVQAFRYRGERRVCLPGQLHILHPDEVHDGAAATSAGFGYRIVYVRPELIR